MLRKYTLFTLALLIITIGLIGLQPPATLAQQSAENFIFINYIGREMTLDLDDVSYTIPGTDTMPEGGRLALQLAAGQHKYAANVPGVGLGSAGEFTITPGQVVAKAARIEQTGPGVDRNGILVSKPKDVVRVFDFDPFARPVDAPPLLDTWQPTVAAPGTASLVWINFMGDELTVDLNGHIYKVAPPANNIPGRLQIEVAPGDYTYTASVPAGSVNGQLAAVAGQVTGLTIYADPPEPRDYKIGEKFDFLQPLKMHVFAEDLTAQAAIAAQPAVSDSAPATLPVTGGEFKSPVSPDVSTAPEGVLIKNYAGDALTFTINNQTYTIPTNAEQTLSLPPGHYTFTASIPFVATTGDINIQSGQAIELSIAINVGHNVLNVYQN
jgi:hypothetical protein